MPSGCLFTDGVHVLAGLQKGFVSGIGGKAKQGETVIYTAWRETLEELLDFNKYQIKDYVPWIVENMKYVQIIKNGSYISFVYSFIDLEKVLLFLKQEHAISQLYRRFPLTVSHLIFDRGSYCEIKQLSLLPMVPNLTVHSTFVNDITAYWNTSFNRGQLNRDHREVEEPSES
jgi:hypothetical protein